MHPTPLPRPSLGAARELGNGNRHKPEQTSALRRCCDQGGGRDRQDQSHLGHARRRVPTGRAAGERGDGDGRQGRQPSFAPSVALTESILTPLVASSSSTWCGVDWRWALLPLFAIFLAAETSSGKRHVDNDPWRYPSRFVTHWRERLNGAKYYLIDIVMGIAWAGHRDITEVLDAMRTTTNSTVQPNV